MSHRQTVEFLRRRYAAAILCDDADTAGRLRVQLDGIMNEGHGTRRLGKAPQPETPRPFHAPARPQDALAPATAPPAPPLATERSVGLEPRLRLVTPVTGLLEWPRPGRRYS